MMARKGLGCAAVGALALAAACNPENQIVRPLSGAIAVTAGDFDDIGEPLRRLVVNHETYEGLISVATWDQGYDPDNVALKVEGLLGDEQELDAYGVMFVASGTRGLGLREYNSLDSDDQFVADPFVAEQMQAWVRRGGVLLASDWAYDLVEISYPDAIDFLGDDLVLDGAQRGEIPDNSRHTLEATVTDERLVDAIGQETLSLGYAFSNWAVIEDVDDDVEVWLRGDVTFRNEDGSTGGTLTDVPLLVAFAPEGATGGRIVFATFHIDAQTDSVVDQLLRTVVGDFDEKQDAPVQPIE